MIRWIGMLVLALGVVFGCDKKEGEQNSTTGSASSSVKGPLIAVIPKGTSHVFWQSVHAGANRAARELGIPDPVWQGSPDEAQVNEQMKIMRDLQQRGVDAMVLAPVNFTALDQTIEEIYAKMPIVIFDSGCQTDKITSFVATDNFKGGQLAGEEMLRLLGDAGGDIAMVRVQSGSESTTQRENGFLEVIKRNPRVKLVFEQYGESNRVTSQNRARDALTAHPDLKGFYGPNESSAFGILKALQEQGRAGKIKFVGFDSSAELAEGLEKGEIDGLVLQNPVRMGYLSLKAAYAALQKQPVEKKQPIEPTLITRANMTQPQMQELLRPNLEKDLK